MTVSENFGEHLDKFWDVVDDAATAIVLYSASWPLARAFRIHPEKIATETCESLLRRFPNATLLMPTFTDGFGSDGICDLDKEKGKTGIIGETLRTFDQARRTRSAFFSFSVVGPARDELVGLHPREAWGDGSLYDWIYKQDAQIVTLGVHPTHCSFGHYTEWLARDVVPYRFNKTFRGTLRHEGSEMPWEETLFVRNASPSPINDFTPYLDEYVAVGMRMENRLGVTCSAISARKKIEILMQAVQRDPLALISNKELFANVT